MGTLVTWDFELGFKVWLSTISCILSFYFMCLLDVESGSYDTCPYYAWLRSRCSIFNSYQFNSKGPCYTRWWVGGPCIRIGERDCPDRPTHSAYAWSRLMSQVWGGKPWRDRTTTRRESTHVCLSGSIGFGHLTTIPYQLFQFKTRSSTGSRLPRCVAFGVSRSTSNISDKLNNQY